MQLKWISTKEFGQLVERYRIPLLDEYDIDGLEQEVFEKFRNLLSAVQILALLNFFCSKGKNLVSHSDSDYCDIVFHSLFKLYSKIKQMVSASVLSVPWFQIHQLGMNR